MTKFFKTSKKHYFQAIFGPFSPNFGKNEFSWKKVAPPIFIYSNIYQCAKKNRKKLMTHS